MNNPNRAFYLITEESFHPTYLIADWLSAFADHPQFQGVLIRGNYSEEKDRVHQALSSNTTLGDKEMNSLRNIYGNITDAEQELIHLRGFPKPFSFSNNLIEYIGYDLNGPSMEIWAKQNKQYYEEITFFVFLDVMLAPWWISIANGSIINAHSAVLPFARGMNAIENMASLGDPVKFQEAAGASIHYIDHNIDTGPLIQTVRLKNSLSYNSIAQVKAVSYLTAFELLTRQAEMMAEHRHVSYVGIKPDYTGPLFLQKNYTFEVECQAKKKYLYMKQEEGATYSGQR